MKKPFAEIAAEVWEHYVGYEDEDTYPEDLPVFVNWYRPEDTAEWQAAMWEGGTPEELAKVKPGWWILATCRWENSGFGDTIWTDGDEWATAEGDFSEPWLKEEFRPTCRFCHGYMPHGSMHDPSWDYNDPKKGSAHFDCAYPGWAAIKNTPGAKLPPMRKD